MKSDVAPYSSATKKSRELEATGKGRVTRNRDAFLLLFAEKKWTELLLVKIAVRGNVPVPWESSLVGP